MQARLPECRHNRNLRWKSIAGTEQTMIDKALNFLKQELNEYLKLKTGVDKKVDLSAIVAQNGTTVVADHTIAMMMVSVEEEKMMRGVAPQTILNNGKYSFANPELKLNLYVLFASHHDDHYEALKMLSHVVQFFQGKHVFDNKESPQLGEQIEEIAVDLYTLNFEQQNQLWASVGAKYMPSVLYRVRLVVINEKIPTTITPAISGIEAAFAGGTE